MNSREKGFTVIEVVGVLVVVALLAFVAWTFVDSRTEKLDGETGGEQVIENEEDLVNVEDELLETDLDSELDTSEIEEVLTR